MQQPPHKNIRFPVILRHEEQYRHAWDVSLSPLQGGIYIFPQGDHSIVKQSSFIKSGAVIDHISFHRDGKTHAKDKNGSYYNAPYLLPIQQIGYQALIEDHVGKYEILPTIPQINDKSVVLKFDPQSAGMVVKLSIISGRLIADGTARSQTIGENNLLAIERRALGWQSDNADKMLQFALYGPDKKLNTPRHFFLPPPAKSARPEY